MKKFSTRFFVMLTALLVSGFSQWYARSYRSHTSSVKISEQLEATMHAIQCERLSLVYSPSTTGGQTDFPKSDATEMREEEEDERDEHDLISAKSGPELFDVSAAHYFFDYFKVIVPADRLQSSTLSCRYLILRVFRI